MEKRGHHFWVTFWTSSRVTPWQITHITLLVPWLVSEKGGTESYKWLHVQLISSYDCRTFRYYCRGGVKRAFTQRTNQTLVACCGSPDSISFNHKLEFVCDLQMHERKRTSFPQALLYMLIISISQSSSAWAVPCLHPMTAGICSSWPPWPPRLGTSCNRKLRNKSSSACLNLEPCDKTIHFSQIDRSRDTSP